MPLFADLEKGSTVPLSLVKKTHIVRDKDWEGLLDASSHLEVLDISSEDIQWTNRSVGSVEDVFKLPDSVRTRLYLVEGTTEETCLKFSIFSERFFRHHSFNVLPFTRCGFGDNIFFGKWFRRVYQNPEQRFIEERISRGRPYSSDRLVDPQKLRLDHERYKRVPCIPRRCSSLEPYPGGHDLTRMAIGECASACFRRVGNAMIGRRLVGRGLRTCER